MVGGLMLVTNRSRFIGGEIGHLGHHTHQGWEQNSATVFGLAEAVGASTVGGDRGG